jgi:hypothetical protein
MQILRVSVLLASLVFVAVACTSNGPEAEAGTTGAPDASGPKRCGRAGDLCAVGDPCEGAPDCESGVCRRGVCRVANIADNEKNRDETDVDCGGESAPACDDGKRCAINDDCKSGVCKNEVCQAPGPNDGVKNGDETGVDCGGPTESTPRCTEGQGCLSDSDCDRLKCDVGGTGKCLPASHDDGIKNLDETDVDCGGPGAAKRCAVGQACQQTSDCDAVRCNEATHTCDPPSADDGIKNGTETDVDCGGGAPTNAKRCAADQLCTTHSDCASQGCDDRGRCAVGRTCTQKLGGRTCGPGEVVNGEPAPGHESCCVRVPIPGTDKRMDKYMITAGRMRQFVMQQDGKIRDWVSQANIPGWQPAWNALVPNSIAEADIQLGAYWTGAPNDSNGAQSKRSCDADWSGGHTYWTNNPGETPSDYTKDESDVKALNCVGWHLARAFCAYEGGRLPTRGEMIAAYKNGGATSYPWGNAFDNNRLSHQYNYNFPYNPNRRMRGSGAGAYVADIAVFIAPPGRFPAGANSVGAQDIAGNLLPWVNDAPYRFMWTYSWERHTDQANQLPDQNWQSAWPGEPNGYYAIGARCAYD